ncbi:MAG: hypothetical protein AB8C13_09580 [Phycisphaerales bacterium]
MRQIHYQVADRLEFAEWLRVRNPVKRRNTTIIESYDMSIEGCVPVVFSIDKDEIRPTEYDQISYWIEGALTKASKHLCLAPFDSSASAEKPEYWSDLNAIAEGSFKFEDTELFILDRLGASRVEHMRSESFITVYCDDLNFNDKDIICMEQMGSAFWGMNPTLDQIRYMLTRFPAFASCIKSHYPAAFPAYVLWCRSEIVNKLLEHADPSITVFKPNRPILQCMRGDHDWA